MIEEKYIKSQQLDLLNQGDRNLMKCALDTIEFVDCYNCQHTVDKIVIYKEKLINNEFIEQDAYYKENIVNPQDINGFDNLEDVYNKLSNCANSIFILAPKENTSVEISILEDKILIRRDNSTLEVPYNNRFALKLCSRINEKIQNNEYKSLKI